MKMFYVYEWFNKKTNYVFYVGKGCRKRFCQTAQRNRLFKNYIKQNDCDCRIIKNFDNEEDAFAFEHERIMVLKAQGQAHCNLDHGGVGGHHFAWTAEMRKYKSVYNPMKEEYQRARMSKNNPMKNTEVANRVASKRKRPVVLNGIVFTGIKDASIATGRAYSSITKWCKRGYDDAGSPCSYLGETQKEIPHIMKTHPKAATPKAVIVDGIFYDTVTDGAKSIGVWAESLIRAIKSNRKIKNHTCSYANQQPSRKNAN